MVAVDYSGNRSVASDTIQTQVLDKKALICQIQFDDSLNDLSPNHLDASTFGDINYSSLASMVKSGTKSANFNSKTYAMLPYSVAWQDEITICTWMRWTSSSGAGNNNQRIFEFGNNENQTMYLTPNNGSEMRLVMRKGDKEQILGYGKKMPNSQWKHVAVTLKPEGDYVSAVIYIDGDTIASTEEFTLKASDIAPSLCFIGRSLSIDDPLVNGRYDDFRIYNYALNQEEIKKVMEDNGEISEDLVEKEPEPDPIPGDVNEDGKVDINDVVAVINIMAGNTGTDEPTDPTETDTPTEPEEATAPSEEE